MISIVIPCFNEEEGLEHLASKLKDLEQDLREDHEFVFVDDGSSDSTYDRLRSLYRDRIGNDVKVVKHAKNTGVGAAIKTGASNSRGDYIATIDSDCTYEPSYLVKMLDIIKNENADIVTASPYHPKGSTLNVPAYRLFLSRNLSNLYNIVVKSKFYTYTSMFRIYKREALKNSYFRSDGFLAMAEILIKARKKGLKIVEYPATLKVRQFGSSHAKSLKLIREHLCFIMRTLLRKENA
ncbi:MAG: glycosyltransferase family 2 protein [Candidatus Omnitrophica bacterium]|nr:glycosyltransferase family 2 protein [Candidatus Omnitrophota bacterium]